MKDELLRKVQRLLDRRISNETQVVYLLVELRKLMDRDGYTDPILRTFSNWVVHTSLENRADGSTLILSEFDRLMGAADEDNKNLFYIEHISLGTFREALVQCFEHFGLSAKFVANAPEWKKFGELYCLIVSECPIVFTASKTKLKYIKRVELQAIGSDVLMKKWPLVEWRLTFHDGREMYLSFPLEQSDMTPWVAGEWRHTTPSFND
jgi:hypothetical protein